MKNTMKMNRHEARIWLAENPGKEIEFQHGFMRMTDNGEIQARRRDKTGWSPGWLQHEGPYWEKKESRDTYPSARPKRLPEMSAGLELAVLEMVQFQTHASLEKLVRNILQEAEAAAFNAITEAKAAERRG